MKRLKNKNLDRLKSVVSLLDYIDSEIGDVDNSAQKLIRVGTEILRQKVLIGVQPTVNQNNLDHCSDKSREDLIKLAG